MCVTLLKMLSNGRYTAPSLTKLPATGVPNPKRPAKNSNGDGAQGANETAGFGFLPTGGVTRIGSSIIIFDTEVSKASCHDLLKCLWNMQEEHADRMLHIETMKDNDKLAFNTFVPENDPNALKEAKNVFGIKEVKELLEKMRGAFVIANRNGEVQPVDLTDVPIELYISSPGGSLRPALGLIDEMVRMQRTPLVRHKRTTDLKTGETKVEATEYQPREIRAHAHGMAASAAFMIMLGASRRTMGPSSSVMCHDISSSARGNAEELAHQRANLLYASAAVRKFVVERTGLVQYAYNAKPNDGVSSPRDGSTGPITSRQIFVTPVPREKSFPDGYKAVAESKKGELIELKGLQIYETMVDLNKPAIQEGVHATGVQLARVCGPMMKKWVKVINERNQQAGTVNGFSSAPTVEMNDTVAVVFAALSIEDKALSAAEAQALGIVNDSNPLPQARLADGKDPTLEMKVKQGEKDF